MIESNLIKTVETNIPLWLTNEVYCPVVDDNELKIAKCKVLKRYKEIWTFDENNYVCDIELTLEKRIFKFFKINKRIKIEKLLEYHLSDSFELSVVKTLESFKDSNLLKHFIVSEDFNILLLKNTNLIKKCNLKMSCFPKDLILDED